MGFLTRMTAAAAGIPAIAAVVVVIILIVFALTDTITWGTVGWGAGSAAVVAMAGAAASMKTSGMTLEHLSPQVEEAIAKNKKLSQKLKKSETMSKEELNKIAGDYDELLDDIGREYDELYREALRAKIRHLAYRKQSEACELKPLTDPETIEEIIRDHGQRRRGMIHCNDGFSFSAITKLPILGKAAADKDSSGEWVSLELGRVSREEPLLEEYAENWDVPTETRYMYVPVDVIRDVIIKHGGFDADKYE